MKHLLLLAAVCIGLFACTTASDKVGKENLAVARKYMEAVETQNVAVMDSLLADNYMGYGPSVGDSINKADAVAAFKYNAENLYESLKYSRHKEIAFSEKEGPTKGDWVLTWVYLEIKYKDGRGPVYAWVNIIYRIENGKIVHSRTFYNEADVLRQLGYEFVPANS
ncbi:MAG: nuclear transport factor 2 family protein [Saprospiraceae bacterium]|nr:nuclear transport factor 2 family protein [Saprospiraceae bacterium]